MRELISTESAGDEFVIICREWSKEVFEEKVELLRKNFERDSICRAAVGSRWAEGSDDLSQIIADADARMYEDKKEFYRRSPVSRRYRHQSDEVINLSNPEVLGRRAGKESFCGLCAAKGFLCGPVRGGGRGADTISVQ